MTFLRTNLPGMLTASLAVALLFLIVLVSISSCSNSPPLQDWHEEKLNEEFTAERRDTDVRSFKDYLLLEDRLFQQLDRKVYANTDSGTKQQLNRYSSGSLADPRGRKINWNRSFELPGSGKGAVLLLHGMSDSPYSLRAIGLTLNQQGYHVIGLRSPGHGTAPSGLKHSSWQDMAAAVELAINHLNSAQTGNTNEIHIIGYSTGASLALDFTLKALSGTTQPVPASLVLISPAIRIHAAAGLAGLKNGFSVLPGLGSLAWLSVMDEFDPYKYNSFATNAGAQVHAVTTDVDRRLRAKSGQPANADRFPRILVFKSTVDSTVTTDAVVDNLLNRLPADGNEIVLFDINRQASIKSTLMVSDPAPLTDRLMKQRDLPFAVTLITNESPESMAVVARYKPMGAADFSTVEALGSTWPRDVISLSHVALPIPPDDPLYGQSAPPDDKFIFLGNLAIKGERGLLNIPADWLLRMRYNPFYHYLEERVIDWVDETGDQAD